MILSDAVTRVADEANVASSISSVKARIIRNINRVSSEIWDGKDWSWRWRNIRTATDTDVTSGTITATNGSRTITGSGTSFSSSHVTWHIYFPGDSIQNWYKIRAFTSSTQLELDIPYQGTTGGSKAYFLRHFDYVLPTEMYDIGSIIVTNDRRPLNLLENFSLDIVGPVPYYKGYPIAAGIYSSDSMPTTYSTGTLSGTINTTTITGSGTSWLNNVYPGDLLTIGSYTYTVRSIDSDTQITLYNQQQVTSNAGTSYTNTRQFGRILRIMWASDNNYVLDIRYLRKFWPLVNDNDTNELFYRCPNAITLKAAAVELRIQKDSRFEQFEALAELDLAKLRAEDDAMTPRDTVSQIYGYRTDFRRDYRVSLG